MVKPSSSSATSLTPTSLTELSTDASTCLITRRPSTSIEWLSLRPPSLLFLPTVWLLPKSPSPWWISTSWLFPISASMPLPTPATLAFPSPRSPPLPISILITPSSLPSSSLSRSIPPLAPFVVLLLPQCLPLNTPSPPKTPRARPDPLLSLFLLLNVSIPTTSSPFSSSPVTLVRKWASS